MKALSINQPWAFLIVNGFKGVENRDWDTRYAEKKAKEPKPKKHETQGTLI